MNFFVNIVPADTYLNILTTNIMFVHPSSTVLFLLPDGSSKP